MGVDLPEGAARAVAARQTARRAAKEVRILKEELVEMLDVGGAR